MKLKYILMIFILITTILCFTSYRNILFNKVIKLKELFTEEEEEDTKDTEDNGKKNKKKSEYLIKNYPISGNISSTINSRITSTGSNTIDDPRFNKLKNILRAVALKGRKQIIIKSLTNKNINYATPIKFNKKNLKMKQKKIYPNEIKPIIDYILNQINSIKIRKDDTYHKLRLIQLNNNDVIRYETDDEVKYNIEFISKYYSNYFNNKKNKKISKIDDLIINCEIIGKKQYLDDVFIKSIKAGKNVKLIINQLEITGVYSKNNYLSGYEGTSNNYKLLDNFNTNKERDIQFNKPSRVTNENDDNDFINLKNYNQNESSMVKINSNYKKPKKEEKSYFDSIDSLLPDSYREPDANNNLLTEDSETNYFIEEEEEEEYDIDSVNMTSDEAVIKPNQIVVN